MKNILKTTALGITTILMFVTIGAMVLYSNYDPVQAQNEKIADERAKQRLKAIEKWEKEQQKVAE